jgi:hypothetical protein
MTEFILLSRKQKPRVNISTNADLTVVTNILSELKESSKVFPGLYNIMLSKIAIKKKFKQKGYNIQITKLR